jgi:itaconate CoA-transferase
VRHPQLAARNRWREIDSPVGKLSALMPPATIDGVETVMGPVPEVGADTDRILSDIGYGAEDIAALRKEEII